MCVGMSCILRPWGNPQCTMHHSRPCAPALPIPTLPPPPPPPADTAGLHVPAVALVSTLSSITPAPPFVFRNYQLPPGAAALAASISAHGGSCKHPVWQAVRASSAASFYMEDFRWLEGGAGVVCG